MSRHVFALTLFAVASAALGAQEASQTNPYQGTSNPPSDDTIVVGGLADNGPAEQAGLRAGDRILSVNQDDIADLASLWRRVWASGSAGAEVRLRLQRDATTMSLTVRSGDRTKFLKAPKLH